MILCTKEHLLPIEQNVVTILHKDMYFYVHRNIYDQAVILTDRYDISKIKSLIQRDNNKDVIQWLVEELPKPLDILAPFLALVEDGLEQDIEQCCGVLTALTSDTNLRWLMKQQTSVIKEVKRTLAIKYEYQMVWDLFLNLKSIPYSQMRNAVMGQPQSQPQVQQQQVTETAPVNETEDERRMREENERIRKQLSTLKEDDSLGDFIKGKKTKKDEPKKQTDVVQAERERVRSKFTI